MSNDGRRQEEEGWRNAATKCPWGKLQSSFPKGLDGVAMPQHNGATVPAHAG